MKAARWFDGWLEAQAALDGAPEAVRRQVEPMLTATVRAQMPRVSFADARGWNWILRGDPSRGYRD